MRIQPPVHGEYERIIKDANDLPLWGVRNEHTPDEEIVHIPTGTSNHTYYQPDIVVHPTGCEHEFRLVSMDKREIECSRCNYSTSFHVGINTKEEDSRLYFYLKDRWFPISL